MEIKRYGLTEEEIKQNAEHLRKEGLSDAEIEATVNEMNREKVLDQLYEEGAIPDNWKTIQASDTFKQLRQLMPQLHPAYIGFCLSSPNADPFLPRPDDLEGWKKRYEQMKESGEINRLHQVLSEAFAGCDFDVVEFDGYDFSPSNMEMILHEVERLLEEAEKSSNPADAKEKETLADKYKRIADAQEFSLNFLPVAQAKQT